MEPPFSHSVIPDGPPSDRSGIQKLLAISRFRVRFAPRNDEGVLLRRELEIRRGGADFGIDLGFELGKVLLEHADQRARSLVEIGLVLPGVDGIEYLARHA